MAHRNGFKSELAQLRNDRELTQGELAAAVGIDRSVISRYEDGSAIPTLSSFRSLREALGVTSDELFLLFEKVQRRRARTARTVRNTA